MNVYDWSKFDIFIYIKSKPDLLFDKWATSNGLESFFLKKVSYQSVAGNLREGNEQVEPGDKYTWEFIHGAVLHGTILDVSRNKSIAFSFGEESIVEVLLTRSNNRTLVHLKQKNIPTDEKSKVDVHLNCRGAWIHFLTVLKSVVEFDADCRDKESLTSGSFGSWFYPKEYSR